MFAGNLFARHYTYDNTFLNTVTAFKEKEMGRNQFHSSYWGRKPP